MRDELGQTSPAKRFVATADGTMPKNVTQPVAVAIAQAGDHLVRGMTIRAGITAVLDQGHVGLGASQDMIAADIDLRI